MRQILPIVAAALLLHACGVDPSPPDEAIAPHQLKRALNGIGVSKFEHRSAGFRAYLPVGPTWNVAELPHRFLALESGVPEPVTIVISVRRDVSLAEVQDRWLSAFNDKDFKVIERSQLPDGAMLAAEGTEAVSGDSVDYVLLLRGPGDAVIQCSVGTPVVESGHWSKAIVELCRGVVVSS